MASKTATKRVPERARESKDAATLRRWDEAVRAKMIDAALFKHEAIRALALERPDLHSDYLESYNRVARRDKDLKTARAAVRREKLQKGVR